MQVMKMEDRQCHMKEQDKKIQCALRKCCNVKIPYIKMRETANKVISYPEDDFEFVWTPFVKRQGLETSDSVMSLKLRLPVSRCARGEHGFSG